MGVQEPRRPRQAALPDRRALRELLSKVLPLDADMDAFCCDYFPAVHVRFSRGMDRQEKLTILISLANAAEIMAALHEAHPDAVPAAAPPPSSAKNEPRKPEPSKPEPGKLEPDNDVPPKIELPKVEAHERRPESPGAPVRPAPPSWMRLAPAVAGAVVLVGVAVTIWAVRGSGAPRQQEEQRATAGPSAGGELAKPAESTAQPPHAAGSTSPASVATGLVALADVAPMRFVSLPGGRFEMGSPSGEADRGGDETQHPAEVGPFELGIHEVTQKQWDIVMDTRPFDCGYGCGDDLPAQKVSWVDAAKFMNALTDRENKARADSNKRTRCYHEKTSAKQALRPEWAWDRACTGYRLPTEAEWEYAARAGTTAAYSFGNDPKELCKYANGADQAAKRKHPDLTGSMAECNDGYADIAPVGKLEPNPWGLYDMHGNVWEWVWDWYGPYPKTGPLGHAGGSRVLRGGSFVDEPRRLRSSDRGRDRPTDTDRNVGFRCARGSPPSH